MQVPKSIIDFQEEDIQLIQKETANILRSGMLTLGRYTLELEADVARLAQRKHAVAVSSGTAALEIALRILRVQGREVIVQTNTNFATPAAVLHAGGTVKFVDIEPVTMSISVERVREAVGPNTAGVIVVHIGGVVAAQISELADFCSKENLFLLEDAAHAHGSEWQGMPAGSFGDVAAFSFYPTKLVTSLEGGALVTDDRSIYEEAIIYRDQGKQDPAKNYHVRLGYSWRMSEVQALVGWVHLKRLHESIERRRTIAAVYDAGLPSVPHVAAMHPSEGTRSNYYKYLAALAVGITRPTVKETLRNDYDVKLGGEVYEIPCHRQPVFADCAASPPFPVADDLCARHICLPVYSTMTEGDARYVIDSLAKVLARSSSMPDTDDIA